MAHGFFKFSAAAIVVGTALYAGIGYVGVPYATKTLLDQFISAKIGRPVVLEEVRFNPWTWTYELKGLEIPKKSGGSLLHLNRLLIDASAQTLIKFAPVLDEISIDGLHIDAVMDNDLKADIAALTGKTNGSPANDAQSESEKADTTESTGLPGFALYNIAVTNSSIHYADKTLGIDQSVTDLTLKLPFVSTLESARESLVTPALSLKLNGTPIEATGSTKPFGSSLEAMLTLKVDNLDIAPLTKIVPMLQSDALYIASGKFASDLNFIFRNPTGGEPAKMLLSGSSSLTDLSVKQGKGQTAIELTGFKKASITLKEVNFVSHSAALENAVLDSLRIYARRSQTGINLLEAINSATVATEENQTAPSVSNETQKDSDSPGWSWSLAHATLKNGSINWQDSTLNPAAKLAVTNMNAEISALSSNQNKPADLLLSANLLGGSLNIKGTAAASPLAAKVLVTGQKLSAKTIAGYIKQASGLDVSALANFGINVDFASNSQRISGTASLTGISVKEGKQTLLSAKQANTMLNGIDLLAQSADVASVSLDGLVVNAVNTKKGLNLAQIGEPTTKTYGKTNEKSEAQTSAKTTVASKPWAWKVGSASLSNSTFNLRDETLKPIASTSISRINATVKNLSSAPGSKSVLDIAFTAAGGTVNAAGAFTLSPLSVSANVEANKLQLKTISPFLKGYTGLGAKKGTFAMQGQVTVANEKDSADKNKKAEKAIIGWKGNMSLADLDLTNAKGSSIMSWTKATLTGMDIATTDPIRIAVAKAEIEQPAQKQTKVVRELAGIASLISAVRGKTDTAEKIDKYSSKLEGTLRLENIRYINGKFSAEGVSAASVGGVLLEKLSEAVSKKLAK